MTQPNYDSLFCLYGGEIISESELPFYLLTLKHVGEYRNNKCFSHRGDIVSFRKLGTQVNALSNSSRFAVSVWGGRILFENKSFLHFILDPVKGYMCASLSGSVRHRKWHLERGFGHIFLLNFVSFVGRGGQIL